MAITSSIKNLVYFNELRTMSVYNKKLLTFPLQTTESEKNCFEQYTTNSKGVKLS